MYVNTQFAKSAPRHYSSESLELQLVRCEVDKSNYYIFYTDGWKF